MTTLLDLRNQIRSVLASTTDWPDSYLDRWIHDSVRLYSAQFPRRWRYTLSLTTGTQAYPLPGGHGLQAILSVEYPTSEDPQSFLDLVEEHSDAFQHADDVYALRGVPDTTAIDSDTAVAYLVFAETVATGEYAVIEYLGAHPLPDIGDDDAQITIPSAHLEAITAYVDFRSHYQLESGQAVVVDANNITLSQLGQGARMAWNRYKEVIDRLTWLQSGISQVIPWNTSRIY